MSLWLLNEAKKSAVNRKAYHGIETCGALSVTSVGTEHTFTIAGGVTYWYQGTEVVHSSPVEIVLGTALASSPDGSITQAANKLYYVFFNGTAGLKAGNTMNLKTKVPVAILYTNNDMTACALTLETHNYTRDLDWHSNAHRTIGTRYYDGLALNKPTGSSAANGKVIEVSMGRIYDEDILHIIRAPGTASDPVVNCRVWHQVSAGVYTWYDSSRPYLNALLAEGSVDNPKFIKSSDYTLGNVANNRFINSWVYATNDLSRPIYIVAETIETQHSNTTSALNVTPPILQGIGVNELAPEYKLIYRLVYRGNGILEAVTDYRTTSSIPAGQVSPTNAASVFFSPTFDDDGETPPTLTPRITATNVQSAVDQAERRTLPAGGTTGQFLRKKSDNDYDVEWITIG